MTARDQLMIPGVGTVPVLGEVDVDDIEQAELERQRCFLCLNDIKPGEPWQQSTPADWSYSLTAHTSCLHGDD